MFFQSNLSAQKTVAPSAKRPASILDSLVISVSTAKTEIRLALEITDSNPSLESCLDLNNSFQLMFPDSRIALLLYSTINFQLSETKCSYYVTFGVSLYVRKILTGIYGFHDFLSFFFDESLNINSYEQKKQMDRKIRFWSNDECHATTRYYDSNFLTHGNVENVMLCAIW